MLYGANVLGRPDHRTSLSNNEDPHSSEQTACEEEHIFSTIYTLKASLEVQYVTILWDAV